MKRIKRTITMRKVEIVRRNWESPQPESEVCPFCHSTIPQIPPTDSAVAKLGTAESPSLLKGLKRCEKKGEKND